MVSTGTPDSELIGRVLVQDDWDFADLGIRQTQYLTHFFHHYTAKFIPQIPQNVIHRYANPGDVVVDPFVGSGTTLVEAHLAGCHAYGVDINPLAIKIATAKVSRIDGDRLERFLSWLRDQELKVGKPLQPNLLRQVEPWRNGYLFEGSDKWFRSDVSAAIKAILYYIEDFDEGTKNFVEVGLSSLLKGVSNARMDTVVPTLPDSPCYIDRKHYYRPMDNEAREINVYARLRTKLARMGQALATFHRHSRGDLACRPIRGDSRQLTTILRRHGVKRIHLVVTSPPYWNAQNYQGLHSLSFKLFGLPEPGEQEIGRKKRDYLGDMGAVIGELAKILDGHFALVIGAAKEGTHEQVCQLAIDKGMELAERITRTISNHAFFAKSVKEEHIFVFRNTLG